MRITRLLILSNKSTTPLKTLFSIPSMTSGNSSDNATSKTIPLYPAYIGLGFQAYKSAFQGYVRSAGHGLLLTGREEHPAHPALLNTPPAQASMSATPPSPTDQRLDLTQMEIAYQKALLDWDRRNDMVLGWLQLSLTPTYAPLIADSETISAAWALVCQQYGTQSITSFPR